MRIIAGRHKGRALKTPKDRSIRPTADRAREAIFNVLAHKFDDFDFDGLNVLDVFAGTGALGLEAVSRGAARATFIDQDSAAQQVIKANAALLGEWRNVLLLKLDATRLPPPPRTAHAPCDLAFLDAPYEQNLTAPALLALAQKGWLKDGAYTVVEVGKDEDVTIPAAFTILDERTYGAAKVLFLRFGE